MPRRTLLLFLVATVVALACHARADRQPYGQYLSEILGIIDRDYVEPVDEEKLFEGAVQGMVGQLDEHSTFITREDLANLRESLDQKFGGIGIEVTLAPKTKTLTVLSPIVGTPAYEAGIRTGDQIVAVDGKSTEGFSLQDAVKKLRGIEGEKVTLTLRRGDRKKPFDVALVRTVIPVDSVRGDSRRPDGSWNFVLAGYPQIGYIRIINFGERTATEVADTCEALTRQNIRGLILDLRENPGGLLNAAVGVCQLFIPPGSPIVTTRGRNGKIDENIEAEDTGHQFTWPMCVLVDRFSASASEIVAACLQDHQRAIIVGERSYGKGTVQKVHRVEGGKGVLKLTTASYWRPSGTNIHRLSISKESDPWGVKPNPGFKIALSDKELVEWHELRRLRDIQPIEGEGSLPEFLRIKPEDADKLDPQLQKAVEALETNARSTLPAKRATEPAERHTSTAPAR